MWVPLRGSRSGDFCRSALGRGLLLLNPTLGTPLLVHRAGCCDLLCTLIAAPALLLGMLDVFILPLVLMLHSFGMLLLACAGGPDQPINPRSPRLGADGKGDLARPAVRIAPEPHEPSRQVPQCGPLLVRFVELGQEPNTLQSTFGSGRKRSL